MSLQLEGRARRLGDNVNTDYLIASRRKRETLDPGVLKRYLLEAVDPDFAASVQPSDLLVAGRNFGCGSAMEIAVTVLQAAGIAAVLAESFARSFYRNAVNNGLLPVECDTARIKEGDRLRVAETQGATSVSNLTSGATIAGAALPGIMLEILEAGGLVAYVRQGRLAR
jgi:3-isopropylmalate/(R)-2-methylmalate dehydratase small subunit